MQGSHTCTHKQPHTTQSTFNQEQVGKVGAVVVDGDVSLSSLVEKHFGCEVWVDCDPNHYAKGLLKNVVTLSDAHPQLATLGPVMKGHFLIGMNIFLCNMRNGLIMWFVRSEKV
jgi:hypothetical protein